MKKRKVRCYIMPLDGMYFAGCITLNLTASGSSVDEARRELDDVIHLYLDYAKCLIAHHVSPIIGAVKDFFTFEEVLPLSLCLAR